MKKTVAFSLILLMLLSLLGCTQQEPQLNNPISFYYPVVPEYRREDDPVIRAELHEGNGMETNLLPLLSRYVCGPESPDLVDIFPSDAYPVSIYNHNRAATVYMSPGFAKLTGIDLTMACACLSATLMDIADLETVNICVKDALLDGNQSIMMSRDSFTLVDEIYQEPSTNE